jgi:AcrR family transcriptional regulator
MASTQRDSSVPKRPARRPKAAAHPDTEQRILAAARAEFVAFGSAGARMQAIARRAGVNKALLHYYFRSKDRLYEAVLNDIMSRVWSALSAGIGAQQEIADVRGMIRAIVSAYTGVLRADPDFPPIMVREFADGGPHVPAILDNMIKSFGNMPERIFTTLARGMKAGAIRPIDPPHVFMNIMGMSAATFLIRPIVAAIARKVTRREIIFNDDFYAARIEAIVTMACDGLFLRKASPS